MHATAARSSCCGPQSRLEPDFGVEEARDRARSAARRCAEGSWPVGQGAAADAASAQDPQCGLRARVRSHAGLDRSADGPRGCITRGLYLATPGAARRHGRSAGASRGHPSWQFAQSYKWHDRALRRVEAALLEGIPTEGHLVDVGANMGLRSIYALTQGRPVTMFEPNAELRPFTERLLEANHFSRCVLENLCIGDRVGSVRFYVSESSYLSSPRPRACGQGGDRARDRRPAQRRSTVTSRIASEISRWQSSRSTWRVPSWKCCAARSAPSGRCAPAILVEVQKEHRLSVDEWLSGRGYRGLAIVERGEAHLVPCRPETLMQLHTQNFLYLHEQTGSLGDELVRLLDGAR